MRVNFPQYDSTIDYSALLSKILLTQRVREKIKEEEANEELN